MKPDITGQALRSLREKFGAKQKVLTWDWYKIALDGYPGWDLVNSAKGLHPPFVLLERHGRIDKTSTDIDREFDDIATGRFYSRDWTSDGIPFVNKGEVYHSGWWFQKREDAVRFVQIYGGAIS